MVELGEIVVGVLLESLTDFQPGGNDVRRKGDHCRASSDIYIDSDNNERFDVTCLRTGKTSKIPKEKWRASFTRLADCPVLEAGANVQALIDFRHADIDYFRKGDRGQITSGIYEGDRGVRRIDVYWPRTQRTSNLAVSMWPRFVKWHGAASGNGYSSGPPMLPGLATMTGADLEFSPLHRTPNGSPRNAEYSVKSLTPRGSPRMVVTRMTDGRLLSTHEPPEMGSLEPNGIEEIDAGIGSSGCALCVAVR